MTIANSIILLLDSWVSYRLICIKIKDMRRDWKRKKTYLYSQTKVDNNLEAGTNDDSSSMQPSKQSVLSKQF